MRIAFDAKRAFSNRSGLGNYSRNLISSALTFHSQNEYFHFAPTTGRELFNPVKGEIVSGNGPSWFWRSFGMTDELKSKGIDLYHGLSNELPLNIRKFKGKKVVTIHDVLFKRFPSYYPPTDRLIYDYKTRKACQDADAIICISDYTKRDLINYYKPDESKLRVIHQQVSPEYFHVTDNKETEELYELDKKYLLYVGTIEERKDLITLLKAIKEVDDEELLLYVVGGKRESYLRKILTYIVDHDLFDRVVFFEKVPSDILPLIYRKAQMIIYPSIFEGWGLPVAEGIVSHRPVITTRNTSMEEAGGDACLYFDAGNSKQLSESINLLLNSSTEREKLITKAVSRAYHFDPKTSSDRINELYNELLK